MSKPAPFMTATEACYGNESAQVTHTIPIVDVKDFGDDPTVFYGRHPATPVIVRGVFTPPHPLGCLGFDDAQKVLGDVGVQVYNAATQGYLEVPAATLFDDLRRAEPRYNVVDHSIVGTPFGDLFDVPAFLSHNWFVGAPADFDSMAKSLVLTPAKSFTPLHLDAYGMQGWMYLIAGRKHWECYSPAHLLALYDPIFKTFFDPRKHTADEFPMRAHTERWVGTIVSGDLMYFPAGWCHQVETPEASLGVGGSLLNDHQIVEHVRWWLWERSLKLQGTLDLKKLLEDLSPDRYTSDAGRARGRAALAMCRSWDARMAELEMSP